MNIRQIAFRGKTIRKAAHITDNNDIQKAIEELKIQHPQTVIVLVGGAGRIGWLDQFPMRKAIRIIARLAEETHSIVIDGGTQAGIMTEIGKQRKRNEFSFPLIGVVFESLLTQKDPKSILDANHTHFFLVPGDKWGDESGWISKIATVLAGDKKSFTVLVNGGTIAKTDVEYSLLEDRPAIVMRGTGRMADEIETTDNIEAVKISQKPGEILEILKAKLA